MFTNDQKTLISKLSDINKVDTDLNKLSDEIQKSLKELRVIKNEIDLIIREKSKGFPWLSDRIAEYF